MMAKGIGFFHLVVVLVSIFGHLLFHPLLVINTKTLMPGGAVVVPVHQHGSGGQVAGYSVAVFIAPLLQR